MYNKAPPRALVVMDQTILERLNASVKANDTRYFRGISASEAWHRFVALIKLVSPPELWLTSKLLFHDYL